MKHVIIAVQALTLGSIILASEPPLSPSSFTSPKDSRKEKTMPKKAEVSKPSPTDRRRIAGGERHRRKENADLITRYIAYALE